MASAPEGNSQGGRPKKLNDPFIRGLIEDHFALGVTHEEILDLVQQEGYNVSIRTLRERLHEWNLTRQVELDHNQIQGVIYTLFYQYFHADRSIAKLLTRRLGVNVSGRTVQRLRLSHNLKRRYRDPLERQAALDTAVAFLERDDEESSAIRHFGAGYLYHYVRMNGNVFIGKNVLYQVYKSHPEWKQYAARRAEATWPHRKNFTVPGPNFMWSLDGYEKLRNFGFSIYACIDAYSRNLIWIHVGRCHLTAMSTLKQFLRTVDNFGYRPYFTRCDHGTETPLWVAAHGLLAGWDEAMVAHNPGTAEEFWHLQGNALNSCHIYGPSTANQRIESWWSKLMWGCTKRWIEYSNFLISCALFVPGEFADQVAVYAIYGKMIQNDVTKFGRLWNGHRIRKQKNRPDLRPGVPADLFMDPDVRNFAVPLGERGREGLAIMTDNVEGIEIDAFLDDETEDWCMGQLEEMGFSYTMRGIEAHKQPHIQAYMGLRDRIREHVVSGASPQLAFSPSTTGGTKMFKDLLMRNYGMADDGDESPLTGSPIPAQVIESINTVEMERTRGFETEDVDIEFHI